MLTIQLNIYLVEWNRIFTQNGRGYDCHLMTQECRTSLCTAWEKPYMITHEHSTPKCITVGRIKLLSFIKTITFDSSGNLCPKLNNLLANHPSYYHTFLDMLKSTSFSHYYHICQLTSLMKLAYKLLH